MTGNSPQTTRRENSGAAAVYDDDARFPPHEGREGGTMAKRRAARTAVATAAAAAVTGRCDEGAELLPFVVALQPADTVRLTIHICNANARVRVFLGELPHGPDLLMGEADDQDEVALQIGPPLPPGAYFLRWSVLTPAKNWRTRTELRVNGVRRFNLKKSSAGNNPVNAGSLVLEVAS
jgi:hypothetical protein